jgi:gluconate 2-dehydrogenase gamma chain
MNAPMNPSRRRLFRAAGAAAAIPIVPADAQSPAPYRFLTPREAAFIEAAVARLIPRDELGAGAVEAGVPQFIDNQLAGAWGEGERLYRRGPFREGALSQGYQLPFTPAQFFRERIAALDAERFLKLDPARQDAFLVTLEKEQPQFFEALLALTIEGFFCDPVYGGNRDMAGWRLIGFPGAYANYYELVDHHGVAFTAPPLSLAAGHRHPK